MSRDLVDGTSRTTYDRFLEFERMMGVYSPAYRRAYNPTPIGFCAFALTLFVYAMYKAGATVPVSTSPALAMGLALFYGGLIQLIAGLYELRLGNNYYALLFCSYAGFWLGLASLYVSGSFNFTAQVTDATAQSNAFGVFFLSWTIFTLAMLVSSVRTNIITVVFLFFLLIFYVLLTASYFTYGGSLDTYNNLGRAAGAIGIFTAAVGWYKGFASLLRKGDNAYFDLPLFDISRRTTTDAAGRQAVEIRT